MMVLGCAGHIDSCAGDAGCTAGCAGGTGGGCGAGSPPSAIILYILC